MKRWRRRPSFRLTIQPWRWWRNIQIVLDRIHGHRGVFCCIAWWRLPPTGMTEICWNTVRSTRIHCHNLASIFTFAAFWFRKQEKQCLQQTPFPRSQNISVISGRGSLRRRRKCCQIRRRRNASNLFTTQ